MTKTLYPEIESAGGLIFALNFAFDKIDSELRVANDNDPNFFPGVYARIQKDNKFSQIYIAVEKKLYLPDFWRDGVCLANGGIDDIEQLAECINYWVTTKANTKQLADKFSFVTPNEHAKAFDEGNEVEYKWQSLVKDPYNEELKSFVELAIKDKILSKLFPYTSLMTLCFSRCTGYPFTYDMPTVSPIIETGEYLVKNSNGDEIGSGSANEALKIVLNNLPKYIGPAVKGTSEDL